MCTMDFRLHCGMGISKLGLKTVELIILDQTPVLHSIIAYLVEITEFPHRRQNVPIWKDNLGM